MFKRLFGVRKYFYMVYYSCGDLEGHIEIVTSPGKWQPNQTNDIVKEIRTASGLYRGNIIIRNIIPMGRFRIKD